MRIIYLQVYWECCIYGHSEKSKQDMSEELQVINRRKYNGTD